MAVNDPKERLVDWRNDPAEMSLQNLDSWHLGGTVHTVPRKAEYARTGIASLVEGWLPQQPLIGQSTRVVGVGSCFARYFVLWLAENGFNRNVDASPHNALVRYSASFESPAVVAQQFRANARAEGGIQGIEALLAIVHFQGADALILGVDARDWRLHHADAGILKGGALGRAAGGRGGGRQRDVRVEPIRRAHPPVVQVVEDVGQRQRRPEQEDDVREECEAAG